jgi:hypothetical protein
VEYTRRLSLAESTNTPGPMILPENVRRLVEYREREAAALGLPQIAQIPVSVDMQYREPSGLARRWLGSYARHVAKKYRHETKPEKEVVGVKIYKVVHQIAIPRMLVEGISPFDPTQYSPYYMGEFDKEGNEKPSIRSVRLLRPDGREEDEYRDPFLFWLVPIMRLNAPEVDPAQPFRVRLPQNYLNQKPKNFLLVHAGDSEEGEMP